jgi:hypothetical protein
MRSHNAASGVAEPTKIEDNFDSRSDSFLRIRLQIAEEDVLGSFATDIEIRRELHEPPTHQPSSHRAQCHFSATPSLTPPLRSKGGFKALPPKEDT